MDRILAVSFIRCFLFSKVVLHHLNLNAFISMMEKQCTNNEGKTCNTGHEYSIWLNFRSVSNHINVHYQCGSEYEEMGTDAV